MDGTSLAIIIPSVMGGVLGLIGIYQLVVKNNTQIKVDDATLIRSNLIPTSKWLEREAVRDKEILDLRAEIEAVRISYETRLEQKNEQMLAQEKRHQQEKQAMVAEMEVLKDEIKELRHTVKNVQATQQVEADVRKIERENATGEIQKAVSDNMNKIT